MFDTILYSVENDLASFSLNRPEVSNGFNIPMCQEILAALEDAEKNEEVKFKLSVCRICILNSVLDVKAV